MAVVALASASGSPGVTTTAVAMALAWPRPVVLVEADPTGGTGILAGYFRGTREYDGGLIEVALSNLSLVDALRDNLRELGPTASVLSGTRGHHQAGALRDLWEPLLGVLADLESSGQDVIVDAGRLGLVGSPQPLLDGAECTLLVSRATLPALAAANSWAETIRRPGTGWRHPGLLLIGEGQPYRASEVARLLDLPVVATLVEDREAAAVYHRGAGLPRRFDTGRYARSLTAAIESVQAHVTRGRFELVDQPAADNAAREAARPGTRQGAMEMDSEVAR
ncbi:hypothetical protein JCM18899A_14520 [Nocardioides sp. AN3]